jgi:hypothetical protein
MKLLVAGGIVGLIGAALAANVERPALPGCGDSVVSRILKSSLNGAAEIPDLLADDLTGATGTLSDGQWRCSATILTNKGPIPLKYSVSLIGPGSLRVSMIGSLDRKPLN